MQFLFEVKISDYEKRKSQSHAMHIMAGLLVLTYGIRGLADLPKTAIQLYTALPAGLVILFLCFFKKKNIQKLNTNKTLRIIEGVFLIMGAIHFFSYKIYLPAILFLLSALGILYLILVERQLFGNINIAINDEGITKPGINTIQKIKWHEVENAVVNADVLTIDLKNNYLFQAKFTNFMTESQILEFNNFCKTKLVQN